MEEWRPTHVSGYEVSNIGRVRSARRFVPNGGSGRWAESRVLRPGKGKNGYLFYALGRSNKNVSAHRLVALAFVDGYWPGLQVNHKNGIRSDNRAENLEWVTCQQNHLHAFRLLGRKPADVSGEKNPNYKHGRRCAARA